MEMTPERLLALTADGPLHPAYLIAGPEMLRVLEAADGVRGQARAQGISEREIFDADSRDFSWNALQASLRGDCWKSGFPPASRAKTARRPSSTSAPIRRPT
jgi:hypothetical protein